MKAAIGPAPTTVTTTRHCEMHSGRPACTPPRATSWWPSSTPASPTCDRARRLAQRGGREARGGSTRSTPSRHRVTASSTSRPGTAPSPPGSCDWSTPSPNPGLPALDSDGFADETAIACAMIQAVKEGAQVLNLSFGMQTVDGRPSVALEQALEVIDEKPTSADPAGDRRRCRKLRERGKGLAGRLLDEGPFRGRTLARQGGLGRRPQCRARRRLPRCRLVDARRVGDLFLRGSGSCRRSSLATRTRTSPSASPGLRSPDSYPFQGTGDSWAVWSRHVVRGAAGRGRDLSPLPGEVPHPVRGPGRAAEDAARARRLREGAAPAPGT